MPTSHVRGTITAPINNPDTVFLQDLPMEQVELDELVTLRDWVRWGASQFQQAGIFFGHGTDNALDEALSLVLHCANLDHSLPAAYLDSRLTRTEKRAIRELFEQRVSRRVPAAYLTGKAYFAGFEFIVNEHVLVPRSPIAELIERGFEPWLDSGHVGSVLDMCCGSGCIGIACAYAFPDALVDLVDVSPPALDVAEQNVELHHLDDRVRVIRSDVYDNLDAERYDLIVSNPPYVSRAEMASLPAEYRHEPALGLEAGEDGMDVVCRILRDAAAYLQPDGIIVIEVGASADLLTARYPNLPFVWLDFEHGGDGVFMLTAEQLLTHRDELDAAMAG